MAHTISHNHTIGDEVFFMHENKITTGKVLEVNISIFKEKNYPHNHVTKITYKIDYKEAGYHYAKEIILHESNIFSSKQDLIDSL